VAIQTSSTAALGCFAPLAMTMGFVIPDRALPVHNGAKLVEVQP